MRLRKKKSADVKLDISSFSDIANLLIIFFIVTTSLARPHGMQLDMPSASKPEAQQQQNKTPTVNLLSDRILYNEGEGEGKEISMNDLQVTLLKKKFPTLSEKDRNVVLEVAEDVDYQRYYRIVTMIAGAGGVVAIMENAEGN